MANREFVFDLKLAATVRVRAPDEATARAQLAEVLECADLSVCHGGVDMPDTFEASLDGEPVRAIDVEDDDFTHPCRKCGADYPQAGDGWDGMCPDCADKAENDGEAV